MQFALWSAIVGLLLVVMALSDSVLARLPLSTSMFYLLAGVAVSPLAFDLAALTPFARTTLLEHVAEVVVLLSLFTSGLKLSVGLGDGRWLLPVRLALLSMLVTVACLAAAGMLLLGLSLGAAVLLAGILAPTDPVLASDVQVAEPTDRDRLRFALTGEAGLNDGTALPVVVLGLGLLGLHEIGPFGWRWFATDVLWATGCGLAIGALRGSADGRLVLYLRRIHKEAVGLDNFLALGLIGLAYGVAQLAHAGGFLAVFAAGVALRRIERRATSSSAPGAERRHDGAAAAAPPAPAAGSAASPAKSRETARKDAAGRSLQQAQQKAEAKAQARRAELSTGAAQQALADPDISHAEKVATDPQHAPAFMAHAMLSFNEQIERIGEVAAVMLIGMMLWALEWHRVHWGFVLLLLLVIRPLSVAIGLAGSRTSTPQRALIGWFGIRGIGSLYYLMYAAGRGIDPTLAATFAAVTLAVVVVSITAHGISVTPLMALYRRAQPRSGRNA
jgi:NhaP-type Na+/H+ or K+/H+ antiporter